MIGIGVYSDLENGVSKHGFAALKGLLLAKEVNSRYSPLIAESWSRRKYRMCC